MNNWQKTEMQALNDYLGWNMFESADEDGFYTYEDEDEGMRIKVKATGDYNYVLCFDGGAATENTLEPTGDAIIATMQFFYLNNDPEMDKLWAEYYASKSK